SESKDAFALRYAFDSKRARFVVDYAAGITGESSPPSSEGGTLRLWDLGGCKQASVAEWGPAGASASCEPGKGLRVAAEGNDPQLSSHYQVSLQAADARYVRIRVSASYPSAIRPEPYISQWYWKGSGEDWSEQHSLTLPIKQDGQPHVYWTFIPVKDASKGIEQLRFDPINSKVDATVQWIEVDVVN
ncbi:MAG TPA: hypothetical protein VM409_01810, partial [Chloroflexia bacterium]|nr:hypothetical protein [Chloroflexia bacterium]